MTKEFIDELRIKLHKVNISYKVSITEIERIEKTKNILKIKPHIINSNFSK